MVSVSPEDLDRLQALCSAATAGPWVHITEQDPEPTGEPGTGFWEVITQDGKPNVILASELEVEDADFVCASRTYMPLLIREIQRLRDDLR